MKWLFNPGLYFYRGKSEEDQSRDVFIVIVGIVVGFLTALMIVAVIQKLLFSGGGNSQRTIEKFPLPWNKGQNKLLRTKDFSTSDCCICLEKKGSDSRPIVKIMCDHEFHEKCISESFTKDERCPKCRQVPGTYSSPERFKAYLQSVFVKNDQSRNADKLLNYDVGDSV